MVANNGIVPWKTSTSGLMHTQTVSSPEITHTKTGLRHAETISIVFPTRLHIVALGSTLW